MLNHALNELHWAHLALLDALRFRDHFRASETRQRIAILSERLKADARREFR